MMNEVAEGGDIDRLLLLMQISSDHDSDVLGFRLVPLRKQLNTERVKRLKRTGVSDEQITVYSSNQSPLNNVLRVYAANARLCRRQRFSETNLQR